LEKDSRTVKVKNFVKFLSTFEKKLSVLKLQKKIAFRIWQIASFARRYERKK
jgi:hypothetical protein